MQAVKLCAIGVVALALSACGNNDMQRGVTGAAAGALTAEVLGYDPLTGAALGGAAGALCDDAGVRGCR